MPRHSSSPRPRRSLPRWLKVSLLGLLVVANLAALAVWWTVRSAESAFRENAVTLEEVVVDLAERPTDAEPLYFLVIGSDSREGVDTDTFGSFAGERSDVVMVVRVDREGGSAQVLSIPRDTIVEIEGHGEDRVNAAFAYGGASLMVRTVRDAFDLPLNHYVEVDFAGFQALVDELGGVEMTFPYPARDTKSLLDVPAGTLTLDGFQALAYARSRNYQELRGDTWQGVEATDIGRTGRQQKLVIAILKTLVRPSTVPEAGSVVASLARHMTVDASLANSSLAQLAFSMRSIGGSEIETATLPTRGENRGGAFVQVVVQPEAENMLDAFRSGSPMASTDNAGIVSVEILNGNGVVGSASKWAAQLEGAGYTVERVANFGEVVETTMVVVSEDRADDAKDLVDDLGFGEVEVGLVPVGVDAVVILGTDAGPVKESK